MNQHTRPARVGSFMCARVARLLALCGAPGPMGKHVFDVGATRSRSGNGPDNGQLPTERPSHMNPGIVLRLQPHGTHVTYGYGRRMVPLS